VYLCQKAKIVLNQTFKKIVSYYQFLRKNEKRKAALLLVQTTLNIFLDLFSSITLLPIILLFFDPDTLANSEYYIAFQERVNVKSDNTPLILVTGIFLFFFSKSVFSYFTIRHKANFMTKLATRLSLDSFKDNLKKIDL
jgi:ABC-type polysaccharide/polyol phosphate export permease